MLTIDEGSELAEHLEHLVVNLRIPPHIAAFGTVGYYTYCDICYGYQDLFGEQLYGRLSDPVAYDVGRWLRERFG